jgi:hypothetical protein
VAGIFDPQYTWHEFAQVWQTPWKGEAAIKAWHTMPPDELAGGLVAIGMPEETARTAANLLATPETGRCILALYRSAAQPKLAEWG